MTEQTTQVFLKRTTGKNPQPNLIRFASGHINRNLQRMGYNAMQRSDFLDNQIDRIAQMDEATVSAMLLNELPPSAFHRA